MRSHVLAGSIVVLACATLLSRAPVRADEGGDALLKQVRAAEKSAKTLAADYTLETVFGKMKTAEAGAVILKKPLSVRMVQKGVAKSGLYSDGKHYVITSMGRQFAHGDATVKSVEGQPAPILLFFGPGSSIDSMLSGVKSVRKVGVETVDGVKCDVLEVTIKELDVSVRLAANPEHIVVRSEVKTKPDGETLSVQTCTLTHVKLNGEIPDAAFALPK
jgi:outer membrane lipoprotein-sorting protein